MSTLAASLRPPQPAALRIGARRDCRHRKGAAIVDRFAFDGAIIETGATSYRLGQTTNANKTTSGNVRGCRRGYDGRRSDEMRPKT